MSVSQAPDQLSALRTRAKGTNVNEETLLATDYLNHFNEIIMMIEMIPDVPECLEDAKTWRPKSYVDHFADSAIADRELAREAYPHAPAQYKEPFDATIAQLDGAVAETLFKVEAAMADGDASRLREIVSTAARDLQAQIDQASAIINGTFGGMSQDDIDKLF